MVIPIWAAPLSGKPVENRGCRVAARRVSIVGATMNNQQWPPPGNGSQPGPAGQSPWSQPDSRWSPQNYRDAPGRDPRQPFGQSAGPPPAAPDIDQFEPPRQANRKTLWLGIGIVAAIVALVLVLQFMGGFTASDPAASPTPSAQSGEQGSVPEPVATGGTSIPFEGNGKGLFEIVSQEWADGGLRIQYRITLDEDQGERSFALYMFTNATLEVADPVNYELATARSGEPFTGTVEFAVDRAQSTLVLASSFGTALTALPIPE